MKTIRGLMTAVVAGLVSMFSTGLARADHYLAINDHAREMEYEAGRSEQLVRISFPAASPALKDCLRELLADIGSTACEIRSLTRRDGCLHQIEDEVDHIEHLYADLVDHMDELKATVGAGRSPYCRSRHCTTGSSLDQLNLKRLCERVEEIGCALGCMQNDIKSLKAPAHRHAVPTPVVPPIQVPAAPVVPSGYRPGYGSHRDRTVSVPVFRHNGGTFAVRINLD